MNMPRDSHRAADGYARARQERMAGERIQRQLSDERWAELAEQKRPIIIDRRPTEPNSIGVPRGVALGAFGSLMIVAAMVSAICWATGNNLTPLGIMAMLVTGVSFVACVTIAMASLPSSYDDEPDMPEGAM